MVKLSTGAVVSDDLPEAGRFNFKLFPITVNRSFRSLPCGSLYRDAHHKNSLKPSDPRARECTKKETTVDFIT